MNVIGRNELKQIVADSSDDALVIETLPREKYEEFHLPGAINVPLDENFEENIQNAVPDKNHKVIVYCWDTECDASSKAAKKMEELGYTNVFDYDEGKKAWRDAGLEVVEPAKSS